MLFQVGFVVPEIDVGWSTGHEEVNDMLCFRSKMQRGQNTIGFRRILSGEETIVEDGCQRNRTQAGHAPTEELSSSLQLLPFLEECHDTWSLRTIGRGG